MSVEIIEVANTAGVLEEFVIITNEDGSKTGMSKHLWDEQQSQQAVTA